jgi:hypothetical protein
MRGWLEDGHLVYRLLEVVQALDIRSISHSIDAKDARGTRLYNPRMMLALLPCQPRTCHTPLPLHPQNATLIEDSRSESP